MGNGAEVTPPTNFSLDEELDQDPTQFLYGDGVGVWKDVEETDKMSGSGICQEWELGCLGIMPQEPPKTQFSFEPSKEDSNILCCMTFL